TCLAASAATASFAFFSSAAAFCASVSGGAGGSFATATPKHASTSAAPMSPRIVVIVPPPRCSPASITASSALLVLVLREVARADRVLPLLLVAVERRVRVGRRVRLALIGALLVRDDLRTLPASGQGQRARGQHGQRDRCARHDLAFAGAPAGAGAGAAPGWPYA